MVATTADIETTYYDERVRAYPVAAATTIFKGSAVAVNAAGNAVSLTDSAAVKFVGIAIEGIINQVAEGVGVAGDLDVRVNTRGVHAMVSAGLALGNQGADLYWADNQTVQLVPTNQYAGKLARFTTATEALLDIEPALMVPPTADDADYLAYPVGAAITIVVDTMVALNAAGYLVPANNAAAVEFVGMAMEGVNNAAGADGALDCFVRRSGIVPLVIAGAAITDTNKPVFVGNATTVTTTPTDRGLFVGVIAKYTSAISVSVDLKPGLLGQCADVVEIGAAANAVINVGEGVAIDADGFGIEMGDATARSFWGIALGTIDNTGGLDGDLSIWVARSGLFQLTAAGLGATDIGREVWATNDTTVAVVPGNVLVGHLEFIDGATAGRVNIKPMPVVGQRTDRRFTISAHYAGAVGAGPVNMAADIEFPRKYVVLSGFADAQTAPGGAFVTTVSVDDGVTTFDLTITGAATHGENVTAALAAPMLITDTDITAADAGGACADVHAQFFCEAL